MVIHYTNNAFHLIPESPLDKFNPHVLVVQSVVTTYVSDHPLALSHDGMKTQDDAPGMTMCRILSLRPPPNSKGRSVPSNGLPSFLHPPSHHFGVWSLVPFSLFSLDTLSTTVSGILGQLHSGLIEGCCKVTFYLITLRKHERTKFRGPEAYSRQTAPPP